MRRNPDTRFLRQETPEYDPEKHALADEVKINRIIQRLLVLENGRSIEPGRKGEMSNVRGMLGMLKEKGFESNKTFSNLNRSLKEFGLHDGELL
ncbi:MAG: hypothetical protein AAB871_01855 [Patescibacteria group bacterium]